MSEPYAPIEVTCKTIQGRFLLRPSEQLKKLVLGVIGRAQFHYPAVRLHLMVVMSNHMHMIVSAPENRSLSAFMNFVNCNIAKEAGRLHDWPDRIWRCRFKSIEILDDDKLTERFHYILSHGCKEGMVKRPGDWPGVNCAEALTTGKPLVGVWVDRAEQGGDPNEKKYETRYEVKLSPLPGFGDLSKKEQKKKWKRIVKDIEEEYVQNPVLTPLILARHPHDRPEKMQKSPKPFCHGTTRTLRKFYREAYDLFVQRYREARDLFFAGDPKAMDQFPPGSFIPPMALPFRDTG